MYCLLRSLHTRNCLHYFLIMWYYIYTTETEDEDSLAYIIVGCTRALKDRAICSIVVLKYVLHALPLAHEGPTSLLHYLLMMFL